MKEIIDAACGVGNKFGLPVFREREADLIELGLRRLTAAGYRILGPDELDAATLERAAVIAFDEDGTFSTWGQGSNTRIARATCADAATAIRALSTHPENG